MNTEPHRPNSPGSQPANPSSTGPQPHGPDPAVVPGPTGTVAGPAHVSAAGSLAAGDIAGSDATPAKPGDKSPQETRPQRVRGYWADVWRRYRRNFLAMVALGYVILLALVAIFSPAIAGTKPVICKYKGEVSFPCLGYFLESLEDGLLVTKEMRKRYSPEKLEKNDPQSWAIWPIVFQDPYRRVRKGEWPDQPQNPTGSKGKPNQWNLLGTNQKGVDVFAQLVHGTRTALLVGFVSTGISAIIGMTLGALAGYFGGWADTILSRLMEVMMCVPALVLILALLAVVDKATIWHTMLVLGLTGWTSIARLTRAEFLKLRSAEYVNAARAIGVSQLRVMFRHILPNSLAPVLVPITFGIASAILVENALSFLGFGSPPPTASWGNLLKDGQRSLEMWWLVFFPGAAIFLTVLAYNLIGEGLQQATDPRLREGTK